MGHTAMVERQQVDPPIQHDQLAPAADTDASQEQSDGTPAPADKLAKSNSGSQHQHGVALQDTSTTSSRDVLLQNALALFLPGKVPPYAQTAAAAAAADGSNGAAKLPGLPNFADSRELQLVAAAFAAGAAAGAAGQLGGALPLLEQFSSGDISNSGLAVESAAPVTADAAADSLPAAQEAAAAAAPQQLASKPKAAKARSSAAASHKSTFRGVFWDRKNNRWRAQVGHNNRKIFMGYFSEPTEAARAYDKKLVQLRGTMAKTNFPLQDYADDLKLHKELRARENGDELLLLPLEELQAHLQQHLQELLPKQPALQKVYNDWSRCKAQSEAMMQLSRDRMRQHAAAGGFAPWDGQAVMGAAAGMGGMTHMDWVCDTADAANGEQAQLAQRSSLAAAGLLDQQWSSSLPAAQQQEAQAQQHAQEQPQPMEVDAAALPPAPRTGSPAKMPQPQQLVSSSRHSSPTGTQEGGSSGGSNTRVTVSSGGGARAASTGTPVVHRQQREPPKTLQQHLLTRLHEQRVHRSSSGTSMDALLAAAAVLEEEEEVAATLCGQLPDFVAGASPGAAAEAAAATAKQAGGTDGTVLPAPAPVPASGDATAASTAAAAGPAGGGAVSSAQAVGGAGRGASEAAAAPKGSKAVHARRGMPGTVVTDHAAVVAAILALPSSKQQQGTAAPAKQQGEQAGGDAATAAAAAAPEQSQEPSKQQQQSADDQGEKSALDSLHRRMLQAPTTEKQILQTVQLADKAGLNKEGQQLLLLVMYHQVIDLQKQLTRQQQQQPSQQPQQQRQKAPHQQLQQLPTERLAGAAQEPRTAPEPASTAAAAAAGVGAAAANTQEGLAPRSPSAKRQQEAQQSERPAKQVCQGVSSAQQQPGRAVTAGVAGGSCASQGASLSVQAKPQPVLDLSSC